MVTPEAGTAFKRSEPFSGSEKVTVGFSYFTSTVTGKAGMVKV